MELSKKDRVFLINQYSILAALNNDEASHYNELITILENGYEIYYSMVDQWISSDMPSEDGKFVINILDLYRAIENLKRKAKSEELENHHYSFFIGFDGNNETEYMSFARFLVEDQGKFREQEPYLRKNDNMNSHAPMIDTYKRMLDKANEIESIWEMSIEEAIEILEA